MGLFGRGNKKVRVTASFPDADYPVSDIQSVSVEVTVPEDMPSQDLAFVVTSAAGWCQELAKSLSNVMYEKPVGR